MIEGILISKAEQEELLVRQRAGDAEAYELLVRSVWPWGWKCVCKLTARSLAHIRVHRDEMVAVVDKAVVDAIRRWDPKRGALTTAVHFAVRSSLTVELAKTQFSISVPVNKLALAKTEEDLPLVQRLDDIADLAEEDSLAEQREGLNVALSRLSKVDPKLASVLAWRRSGETLPQIGRRLGVTRERARQLLEVAEQYVRNMFPELVQQGGRIA